MTQYVKTIGYEAPSYVIKKYLEVENQGITFLIDYLEKLIQTPLQDTFKKAGSSQFQFFGNNKDYTALLLNCYIKEKKTDKISEIIEKDAQGVSNTIFDVETAIDVCNNIKGYENLAIKLAEKYQKWELLIDMYIQNGNMIKALNEIEEKIKPIRDKVKLLQQHGHLLLESQSAIRTQPGEKNKVIQLLVKIARFAIQKELNHAFNSPEFENYQMDQSKKIKMEDLLKIFVDNSEQMKQFMKDLIDAHKDDVKLICNEINPYHKYLECLLQHYHKQKSGLNPKAMGDRDLSFLSKAKEDITSFLRDYEEKLDKSFVLFQFRFYEFYDGLRSFANRMNLNSELLELYMEKGQD